MSAVLSSSPPASAESRQRKHAQRKRVNAVALTLSLLAMSFGLFWLVWILFETVRLGIGGLSLSLFTEMTPPPQAETAQPVPTFAPPKPDPIIYPRNGQSASQTEADRQECNRWATTQPSAMNEASVFNRAVDACMDGRGYTVR